MDYTFDASIKPLGRLASEIARILQGKHKANYEHRRPGEDRVVIENIRNLKVTGRKAQAKVYYRHTGYMGHLKEKSYRQAYEKNPAWILRRTVYGMLPKNFIRDKMIKRLVIKK